MIPITLLYHSCLELTPKWPWNDLEYQILIQIILIHPLRFPMIPITLCWQNFDFSLCPPCNLKILFEIDSLHCPPMALKLKNWWYTVPQLSNGTFVSLFNMTFTISSRLFLTSNILLLFNAWEIKFYPKTHFESSKSVQAIKSYAHFSKP